MNVQVSTSVGRVEKYGRRAHQVILIQELVQIRADKFFFDYIQLNILHSSNKY